MSEIRCPHCGNEITGMKKIFIETLLKSARVVDSTHPCPSCGKAMSKKDLEKSQAHGKEKG